MSILYPIKQFNILKATQAGQRKQRSDGCVAPDLSKEEEFLKEDYCEPIKTTNIGKNHRAFCGKKEKRNNRKHDRYRQWIGKGNYGLNDQLIMLQNFLNSVLS